MRFKFGQKIIDYIRYYNNEKIYSKKLKSAISKSIFVKAEITVQRKNTDITDFNVLESPPSGIIILINPPIAAAAHTAKAHSRICSIKAKHLLP